MPRKKYGKIKGPKTPEQIKKSQKRTTIIIGVAAIVAMGSFLVIPKMLMGGETTPTVAVAPVQKGDITSVLDTSGTVTSLNTKTYFSPVNAAVSQYDLKVGSVVKAGQLLVAFETDTLEKDNQKAELSASATINNNRDMVQKSQKTLDEAATARTNVDIIQGDIDNFKAYINDLNQAITNRTQELASSAADAAVNSAAEQSQQLSAMNAALVPATQKEAMEAANAQLQSEIDALVVQQSQAEFDQDSQTANLLGTQIDTKQDTITKNKKSIDEFKKKMGEYKDMTAEEIQNAITGLSSYSPGEAGGADVSTDGQIAQWQLELQDAQSTLAELQGDLAEAEAKVSAGESAEMTDAGKKAMDSNNNMAELEASSLEELLQKGREGIKADFNGIITKADLTQGSMASQGLELVTVASNREVAVEATVSKYDYDKLQIGQKAVVTIANKEYQGTVSNISKVAKQNEKGAPVITCEVRIDNPDDDIFLGVEAKVSITTASVQNVMMVPMMAVNTGKDSTFCYVVENGVIARKDIEAGVSSTDFTEIKSGLNEGDSVIPELPTGYMEGMQVEAAGADPAAAAGDGAAMTGDGAVVTEE